MSLELPGELSQFIYEGALPEIVERYARLPKQAESHHYGEFDSNVVVLDTETTGFSLAKDELTQIAAARMEKGEVVDWFVTFVNPGKPIPDDVVHLTGIHDEDVATAPHPAEALSLLVDFVGDAKVVAHNAAFDRGFVTKHPAGYPLLENLWIDSLDLSRIALPLMKSHRLIDLVKAFGAPLSTHRADEDVAATCALFRILLAGVDAMPESVVAKIALFATVEEWSTGEVFAYFAEQKRKGSSEGGAAESTAENTKQGADTFSLRALRQRRLKPVDLHPKVDADLLAADPTKGLRFATDEAIMEAFSSGGLVGSLYEDYEERDEQRRLAVAVNQAFEQSRNLLAEAGTGTGKSMAYLVPAIYAALDNDITVGVATKTNGLLDQLVYHELPALVTALKEKGVSATPSYASLKGFNHYPCLLKVDRQLQGPLEPRTVENEKMNPAPAFATLLSFIEQTAFDDIDNLKLDYRLLPRRSFTTQSQECLRRKCPYFSKECYVFGARRKAEAASVVVTNHALLFRDMAVNGGLLPPVRYWVVDEAHGVENEARRAFSSSIASDELQRLVQKVTAPEASRNCLIRVERAFAKAERDHDPTLFYALTAKAQEAGRSFSEAADGFTAAVHGLLYFDTVPGQKSYETLELWLNDDIRSSEHFEKVKAQGALLKDRAEALVHACQDLVACMEGISGVEAAQREVATTTLELKELINAEEVIVEQSSERFVYEATLTRKKGQGRDVLTAAPYSVGSILEENFYERTHSVVYTSATLAVGESFKSMEESLGLNEGEFSPCDNLLLRSGYDFDRQMTIYVANDMPEPNESQYLKALAELLIGTHKAQNGSMLTLFTNRKEMEKSFDVVHGALKDEGLRLVCQKWGTSIKNLQDDFLSDEHLSLFALKSFWEGFDAPGATLKGVIIPKLPFTKPTDPLSCERSQRDSGAWNHYVLPAAVMETKQAAGRLIRKADDEGVLIFADKRLLTKGYGSVFLKSLPSKNVHVCSTAEIVAELEERRGRS